MGFETHIVALSTTASWKVDARPFQYRGEWVTAHPSGWALANIHPALSSEKDVWYGGTAYSLLATGTARPPTGHSADIVLCAAILMNRLRGPPGPPPQPAPAVVIAEPPVVVVTGTAVARQVRGTKWEFTAKGVVDLPLKLQQLTGYLQQQQQQLGVPLGGVVFLLGSDATNGDVALVQQALGDRLLCVRRVADAAALRSDLERLHAAGRDPAATPDRLRLEQFWVDPGGPKGGPPLLRIANVILLVVLAWAAWVAFERGVSPTGPPTIYLLAALFGGVFGVVVALYLVLEVGRVDEAEVSRWLAHLGGAADAPGAWAWMTATAGAVVHLLYGHTRRRRAIVSLAVGVLSTLLSYSVLRIQHNGLPPDAKEEYARLANHEATIEELRIWRIAQAVDAYPVGVSPPSIHLMASRLRSRCTETRLSWETLGPMPAFVDESPACNKVRGILAETEARIDSAVGGQPDLMVARLFGARLNGAGAQLAFASLFILNVLLDYLAAGSVVTTFWATDGTARTPGPGRLGATLVQVALLYGIAALTYLAFLQGVPEIGLIAASTAGTVAYFWWFLGQPSRGVHDDRLRGLPLAVWTVVIQVMLFLNLMSGRLGHLWSGITAVGLLEPALFAIATLPAAVIALSALCVGALITSSRSPVREAWRVWYWLTAGGPFGSLAPISSLAILLALVLAGLLLYLRALLG